MTQYAALDALILKSITDEPKTFSSIYFGAEHGSPNIHRECEMITGKAGEPARLLDRRLQALRKKGLIVFEKGWRKALGQ